MIKYPKLSDMTSMCKVQLPLFPSYSNHSAITETHAPLPDKQYTFCFVFYFFFFLILLVDLK